MGSISGAERNLRSGVVTGARMFDLSNLKRLTDDQAGFNELVQHVEVLAQLVGLIASELDDAQVDRIRERQQRDIMPQDQFVEAAKNERLFDRLNLERAVRLKLLLPPRGP